MEFLALLAGAAIVAASPLVPGLRPTAKKVVAGGIAVVDVARTAVAVAGENWMDLVAEAKAERAAEAEARAAAVETIEITLPEDA
ncbi:MAG TPA: DUF5132 domain-containing protein [Anaerolineae bacterium]|nr:DUF5132 domain-containing protein [Anaerolineae bacterium]HNU04536.1 DUF5132 domain-containing protein [Anaerolineae bacterium]